jgi:hypothetical protein
LRVERCTALGSSIVVIVLGNNQYQL